jgi:hypothetical protein
MLEAHIISPRGSLYYAGEALPYDLETIRQHLRDASLGMDFPDVRLELIIDDDAVEPWIAAWLRTMAERGFQVKLFLSRTPRPSFAPLDTLGSTAASHAAG